MVVRVRVPRRSWDDLDTDCLIHLFQKVDTQTMIHGVQFVCKSWYKTSLHPECWKTLDLQSVSSQNDGSYLTSLARLALHYSGGTVTSVLLPEWNLHYSVASDSIVSKCPALKTLTLPISFGATKDFKNMFCNAKNLEAIEFGFGGYCFRKILYEVSLQCSSNLVSLTISTPESDKRLLGKLNIWAIVKLVPRIKYLKLRCCIQRESLKMILKGCKELAVLDVMYCIGLNSSDADVEMLKLASYIENFKCKAMSQPGFFSGWSTSRYL